MAVGNVTKYNTLDSLFDTANMQWNDATAGNIMFCLVTSSYTPVATHSTTSNLGANIIIAGDGAPVAATSVVLDSATTPGRTYFDTANVAFGNPVTITAKYLVAVQPVTPGTFSATTSKLLFYVDLDDTSPSSSASALASTFTVFAPATGWFYTQ